MGEGHWERKRRHLNEDHAARRKQAQRTIGLIKIQDRIDRISGKIEAANSEAANSKGNEPAECSEELRRLGVEWITRKSAVMAEVDGSPYLSADLKTEWCATLDRATLTDSADDDLDGLRATTLLEAIKIKIDQPGRCGSVLALANGVTALIETRMQARAQM